MRPLKDFYLENNEFEWNAGEGTWYILRFQEFAFQKRVVMANMGVSGSGVAGGLGKGAWDCDNNELIPPEMESTIFEEQPTDEHNYEGIATVPMRKNMSHMAFFCNGCRYRCEAYPDWTARRVKEALFAGGIARQNKPHLADISEVSGIQKWEDIEILYAGQVMENTHTLESYNVPPGCQVLIAIEGAKLRLGKPDPDSEYWA